MSAPPVLGGRMGHFTPKKDKGKYQLVDADFPEVAAAEQSRSLSRASCVDAEGLTQSQVVVYLVTAIIGCGVVVLPSLMAIGGWVVVPVIAGVVTLSFMEIGH